MNKTEKIICAILGLLLVLTFVSGNWDKRKAAEEQEPSKEESVQGAATTGQQAVDNAVGETSAGGEASSEVQAPAAGEAKLEAQAEPVPPPPAVSKPAVEELRPVLENDEIALVLSSYGAVVKEAKLKHYAVGVGPISEANPEMKFDFADQPLGLLTGFANAGEETAYEVTSNGTTSVTFTAGGISRTYTLEQNFQLRLTESFAESVRPQGQNGLSLGVMARGARESDLISVDNRWVGGDVIHHDDEDTQIARVLNGGKAGGCSCGCGGAVRVGRDAPAYQDASETGSLDWLAIKNRFFVTAVVATSQPANGFTARVWRDKEQEYFKATGVAATARYEGGVAERTTVFFVGPKKQSLLWDLGMRDVMEFGMWRWICYPMVWLLNLFYSVIPNYGVAIILLTIFVRLVFWPLTRKSTEGMKKMQEIQPLLKELQAKYKDNPQRLQQETFALYREKKVNPLSSCLPMLIQIPVFIALFSVLRTTVELRYAGFLWINDLSEPEHLFASWFPFGGLNILPILMAATMYLQSKLTPAAGDPSQQKMMAVMMPVLMLVMFYNFASALSLYWTLSQVMSIVQMWMIRRQAEKKTRVFEPEVIDPPTPTRQQRRHDS